MCRHGHSLVIVGRDRWGHCKECLREAQRKYTKTPKGIAKLAREKKARRVRWQDTPEGRAWRAKQAERMRARQYELQVARGLHPEPPALVSPPTPAERGRLLPAATRACPFCARPITFVESDSAKNQIRCDEHERLAGWVVTQRCSNGGLWVTAEARQLSGHAVFYDAEFDDKGQQNPEPIAWTDWTAQDLSRFRRTRATVALDRAYLALARDEARAMWDKLHAWNARHFARHRAIVEQERSEKAAWLADTAAREERRAAARIEAERAKVEAQRISKLRQAESNPKRRKVVWIPDREDAFAAA
jgi:hypothetical protein